MDWSACHIAVAGDVMLDRAWHGDVSRISPEAPVPVLWVKERMATLGGAANVAANVASLGCTTTLMGAVGSDPAAHTISSLLSQHRIISVLRTLTDAPTTEKLRLLGRAQHMLRVDCESAHDIDATTLLHAVAQAHQPDLIVLSDYNKGFLKQAPALLQQYRGTLPVLVDPKHPDPAQYRDAFLVTPNLQEFQSWVGPCPSQSILEEKGQALLQMMHWEALVVTQSEHGLTLFTQKGAPERIPSEARKVFDVTGAGDTLIAVLAASLASGLSLSQSAFLANQAAGHVVGQLGTSTVCAAYLNQCLQAMHKTSSASAPSVILEDGLAPFVAVAQAKAQGKKVVFTNGCFDVLHAGHVDYLKKARDLGDCLVVGLNGDASIAALKGAGRPINPLHERTQVLEALSCVDWVIPFSDPTPLALIQAITPHVLVKGEDYKGQEVVGASWVEAHGGDVRFIPWVHHTSSSHIIARVEAADQEHRA